jgi:hypothetical protein
MPRAQGVCTMVVVFFGLHDDFRDWLTDVYSLTFPRASFGLIIYLVIAVSVAADDDDPWLCDLGARPVDRRSAEGGALDAALFHIRKVGG